MAHPCATPDSALESSLDSTLDPSLEGTPDAALNATLDELLRAHRADFEASTVPGELTEADALLLGDGPPASAAPLPAVRPERPMPMSGSAGRVVHCVGRLDSDEAHGLLWPTVLALSDAGVRQCVVLLHPADAEHSRLLLPRSVPLVLAAPNGVLLRWRRLAHERIAAELRAEPVLAVHLHGHAGAFAGLRAMEGVNVQAPVFFHTPQHPGSGWPWRVLTDWVSRLAQGRAPADAPPAYLVQPGRVDPLSTPARLRNEVLAQPVGDDFFRVARASAAQPLIVTQGRADDLDFAAAYAQIAVLLAGSTATMQFAWLGEADAGVQAVLKAAQVQILPCRDAQERADQLARAWLYVAPEGDSLDARGVIEAMAAGLPCVARPGSVCGELVIDQLSGFVCPRNEDLLQGIARLVDAPALCRSMGRAARERALQRYSRHRFQASMLLAHGLPPAGTAPQEPPPLLTAIV